MGFFLDLFFRTNWFLLRLCLEKRTLSRIDTHQTGQNQVDFDMVEDYKAVCSSCITRLLTLSISVQVPGAHRKNPTLIFVVV